MKFLLPHWLISACLLIAAATHVVSAQEETESPSEAEPRDETEKPAEAELTETELKKFIREVSAKDVRRRRLVLGNLNESAKPHRLQLAPYLRARLKHDEDTVVRAFAARAIGRLSVRRGLPELVAGLRDAQVEVRLACTVALWRLPDSVAVPALSRLVEDKSPKVREWVAIALGVSRDQRAIPHSNSYSMTKITLRCAVKPFVHWDAYGLAR